MIQQAWRHLVRPDLDERPALAVLPFANLSPDPANAYFADGLHEEVLAETLAWLVGHGGSQGLRGGAQEPLTAVSRVIFDPIVFTIRQPPR